MVSIVQQKTEVDEKMSVWGNLVVPAQGRGQEGKVSPT